jgi:uncharacterized protein (DUF58 family)
MKKEEFLDPGLLARTRSLSMAARYVAEGAIGGFHKSPYSGYNAEFSHHREYIPGDELKYIDWKRYGKTGKYYVKQYEESSSMDALLILDQSASMSVDSKKGLSKSVYSRILVSAFSYLLLNQRDGVGFLSFKNKVNSFFPISSRKTQFAHIVDELEASLDEGETDIHSSLELILPALKKKCVLILISDFLDNRDSIMESLKLMRYFKHEVIAFHLMTPEEMGFSHTGYQSFLDVESGDRLEMEGKTAKAHYDKNLKAYLSSVKSAMHQYQVDYTMIQTDMPVEQSLVHYLHKRSRYA